MKSRAEGYMDEAARIPWGVLLGHECWMSERWLSSSVEAAASRNKHSEAGAQALGGAVNIKIYGILPLINQ